MDCGGKNEHKPYNKVRQVNHWIHYQDSQVHHQEEGHSTYIYIFLSYTVYIYIYTAYVR